MTEYKELNLFVPNNDSLLDLEKAVKQRQGTIFPVKNYENGSLRVACVLKPYNKAIEQIKELCKKDEIYVNETTETLGNYLSDIIDD
jgi:hypothetical protein